jgi:predicted nucleic acid-binding protein
MKIIVDTNIVFSAILNSQGKIGQLIINGSKFFTFYTVGLLKDEIGEHKDKILKISGFTNDQFIKSYETIIKRITFVDEILISDKELIKALDLVEDIDENDALFVALTNHLNGKLWTGDKKLIAGLQRKGYSKTLSTDELYEQFLGKQLTIRRRKK